MPVYEYYCSSCKWRFEQLQPMSAGHDSQCPECGTVSRRTLSVFAAVSKSGGPSDAGFEGGYCGDPGAGGGGYCGGGCACAG